MTFKEQLERAEERREDEVMRSRMEAEAELKSLHE